MAKILGGNPNNEFEAIAIIFKLREISVSDIIELTHICKKCDQQSFIHQNIPDMFFQDIENINTGVPIGLYTSIDDIDEEDSDNINNMTIDEYNNIEEVLFSNNIKIFNPVVDVICSSCGYKHKTSIGALDIISKSNLSNIYEQYLDISYYSNMTKSDTDEMYPFEREIFIGLIQKKEDEKDGKTNK